MAVRRTASFRSPMTRQSIHLKRIDARIKSGHVNQGEFSKCPKLLRCASESMSITSPPCATRGAARNPDPVRAALVAIEAGADGITAHLREDRRHIRDDDMARLKAEISKAAEFRDGGDRGHAADRACDQAPCGVPGAGAPRGTHHRGRARRGRTAQRAGAVHRAVERCRHPGVAVHRRRSAPRSKWRPSCARR